MDYVLDQLVKKLEETGELENTMILLTSDNGFMSNNPPVYDMLPKVRELMEKNAEKGVGRPTP